MRALITGGAGLVGSSFCKRLLDQGASVFCVDNLSLGTERHIKDHSSNSNFKFEKWDVSKKDWFKSLKQDKFDLFIHLAANSDISLGREKPWMDYERTFETTFQSLLGCKEIGIRNFLFASTSAVYGEDPKMPTPELTTGMHPVSVYGSGKLASEVFISSFVNNYGLNAWVYRFGNVVGEKLTHGVIYDFIRKLQKTPDTLDVLGNGTQCKTYIDVEDCVSGMLHAFEKSPAGNSHVDKFQVFNLSTEGSTSVKKIAEATVEIVTKNKAKIEYGDGNIGWVGDVPKTSLDVAKMKNLGFTPKKDSDTSVLDSIRSHYAWSN